MARIADAAGIIAGTLALDPTYVDRHVRALRAAKRLTGSNAGAAECADVLCACVSPDPRNATGPFHLPFVGALVVDALRAMDRIEPGHAAFNGLNVTLGEAFTRLIGHRIRNPKSPFRADRIAVSGHGENLTAMVLLNWVPQGCPQGQSWAFFGYRGLSDCLDWFCTPRAGLFFSGHFNGDVVDQLALLLSGEQATQADIPASEVPQAAPLEHRVH